MSDDAQLNVLLYCNRPHVEENASTVIDHLDAFGKFSRNNICVWSSMEGLPQQEVLSTFDCIVIHYTLSLLYDSYIPHDSLKRIRDFTGIKILFIQDEYRRVDFVCDKIRYAGIDAIYTCAPKEIAEKIYSSLQGKVKLLTTLTGYVPEKLKCLNGKAMSERRIDVGYRARKCPFWLGRKSHEKYLIGKLFAEKSQGSGLVCDISSSEKDRIYGSRWTDFILNCKTTLGTESGASIIDFTGRIEYDLNRYQAFRPFAKFEKVPSRYLEKEGEIELQVISPRCFEAAALGTVMVMYPGTYSGILQPGVHFLPLEKDFSNIDEVVGFIQDDAKLEEIARNAKRDLVNSGRFSFESFIGEFDDSLDLIAKEKRWVPISKTVSLEEALSSNTIKVRNSKPRKGNPIMKAIRGLWRNSPPWIRFLVIVTFMKKSYYAHLFALKDKYRT